MKNKCTLFPLCISHTFYKKMKWKKRDQTEYWLNQLLISDTIWLLIKNQKTVNDSFKCENT